MRVLVVGGRGYVGAHIVERLKEDGDEILVTTRRPQNDTDHVYMSFEDDDSIDSVFKTFKPEVVIYCADPFDILNRVHPYIYSARLRKVLLRCDHVGKFILISTMGIFHDCKRAMIRGEHNLKFPKISYFRAKFIQDNFYWSWDFSDMRKFSICPSLVIGRRSIVEKCHKHPLGVMLLRHSLKATFIAPFDIPVAHADDVAEAVYQIVYTPHKLPQTRYMIHSDVLRLQDLKQYVDICPIRLVKKRVLTKTWGLFFAPLLFPNFTWKVMINYVYYLWIYQIDNESILEIRCKTLTTILDEFINDYFADYPPKFPKYEI